MSHRKTRFQLSFLIQNFIKPRLAWGYQHRKLSNYAPIAIGIGLHAGTLMLGTIGVQKRMESTVIADAVNLASRLEGLTKVYGSGILVTESILERLGDREKYMCRFVDRVTVKGKKTVVSVFEI